MSVDGVAALLVTVVLTVLILHFRKKFHFQKFLFPLFYVGFFRTKLGINWAKRFAEKHTKALKITGVLAVFVGFLAMIAVSIDLARNFYLLIKNPVSLPSVGVVLPFDVKGAFYVPFIYWLISIAFIAVIHEASHGLLSLVHKVRVKSSGFAFLGILLPIVPAAFVEPDEKALKKKSKMSQLSVFAAGPFANILAGFALFAIYLFIFTPISAKMYSYDGVSVTSFMSDDAPAKKILQPEEVINEIDGKIVLGTKDFVNAFYGKNPGDAMHLVTSRAVYDITLGAKKDGSAYLGVYVEQAKHVKEEYAGFLANIFLWFKELVYWLYLLNLGVGFFNLIPLGPIDGGRMLQVALAKFLPEKKARHVWMIVSFVFLSSLLTSVIYAFVR